MLVEIVADIEEFTSKIDPVFTIHYEIDWEKSGFGDRAIVILTLYGIAASGNLLICEIVRSASWNDKEIRNGNVAERLNYWIERQVKEFEEVAARLKATRGRYEWR
ncbi:hypothetical protein [Archaeoglobus sp.]